MIGYNNLAISQKLSEHMISLLYPTTPRHLRSTKSRAACHQTFHACKIELTLLKSSLRTQSPCASLHI